MHPRSVTAESAPRVRSKKKPSHKFIQFKPFQGPRATSQPSSALTRFDPTDGFVHRAVDAILDTFKNDLIQPWTTAKERLGVANAGTTVQEFVKMNTKIIPLDPWSEALECSGLLRRPTGSMNPLTIDFVLPRVKKASTSSQPHIVDHGIKSIIPMYDNTPMVRRGEWTYGALQIEPGKGRTLQSWERTYALTARFTVPFVHGVLSWEKALVANVGTAGLAWIDESCEREEYVLKKD